MKLLPQILAALAAAMCLTSAQGQGGVMPTLSNAQWNGYALVPANPARAPDGRPLFCPDPRARVERGKCHVVDLIGRDIGDAVPLSETEFLDHHVRLAVKIPAGSAFDIVGLGPHIVGNRMGTFVSPDQMIVYIKIHQVKK